MRGKCLVIGGGVTGMSCAILLASSGFEVELLEKAPAPAPLLAGFERNGVHFETGFHFARGLEKNGPLYLWLRAMGLDLPLDDCLPETELACVDGGMFPLGCDEEWVKSNFPDSLAGFRKFCHDAAQIQGASPYLRPDSQGKFSPFMQRKISLREYFEKMAMDEALCRMLQARCMLFGVSPAQASLEDLLLVSGAHLDKGRSIPGGGRAIAAAFAKRLAELGVTIRCGLAVKKIFAGRRQIAGIALDNGEDLAAEKVVFTGHPAQLLDMAPEGALRRAWFSHIAALEATPEPVIMYGVGDETLPPLHAWYVTPPCCGEFGLLEDENPSLCLMTGPLLANGDKTCMLFGITRNVGIKRDIRSCGEKRLPFLQGHWRPMGVMGANGMRRHVYGSDGSIYGCAHAWNSLPLLPVTRLEGFFLAGQNILLPGLLGCVVSAAIASSFIAGFENILDRFRKCANE